MALSVFREDERTLVAVLRGQRVGTLTFFRNRWHEHPRVYTVNFDIPPEADDALNVVSLLFDLLARELDSALLLRTVVREDNPLIAVLKAAGFSVQRHVYESTLNVWAFDLSSLTPAKLAFESLGYQITTLSEQRNAPDFEEKFYDLFNEVYTDTSKVMPATLHSLTREEWRESVLDANDIIPRAFFIATYEDKFIGFSNLFRGIQGALETGTFGTARAFRPHHSAIMLSLKQREIAYAQRRGVRAIRMEIDADDPWTLLVCAELPLEKTLDYVSLVHVSRWTVR